MLETCIYLNLFLVFVQQKTLAYYPVTENNHVLVGHVFEQFYATDWFNCIQACHDEPRCISYNYQRSAGANGLCELNDCGVEHMCNRDKSLIYSLGFVFQQIREAENGNICGLEQLAPSAPPEVVRAVNKTMHSIRVTWTEVPVDRQNGDILNYTVSYQKNSRLRHILVIRAPRRFANLTKLSENTRYNITVRASNQNGRGPPSDSITVTTSNGSDFRCPSYGSFRDPNSCFHFYRCSSINGAGYVNQRRNCHPRMEFMASGESSEPCQKPKKPYCRV